jgi:cysteine desulfurase
MNTRPIYLDHVSATPIDSRVFEAMKPFFSEQFGNPSSSHRFGLHVRDALSKAREQIALLINAESPDEIFFTSGGTEANNWAVKGVAFANEEHGRHIVISDIEHPSVLESVAFLEKRGFSCTRVKVDAQGLIDPKDVRKSIRKDTILVAIQHCNPDIGSLQNISEIAEVVSQKGIAFFSDASASGGLMPMDVQKLGVSLMTLTPHRFYGPKGIGILYRNRRARLEPLIHGGVQESGRRAGTENIPGIVGAGMAAEIARKENAEWMTLAQKLQKRFFDRLMRKVEGIQPNGPPIGKSRLPYNVAFAVEGIEGEGLQILLDHAGVCVSSGASCVSKALKGSHVLQAIGRKSELIQSSIVMSLGKDNTVEEMDVAVEATRKAIEKLRSMSPSWRQAKKEKKK